MEIQIEKKMYKVDEVAKMLDVNFRTVYRLMKAGKIRAVKVGGQWRIPKSEIEKYIQVEVKNG
jgi:excisionase family DNA binding protein